jgi:hypothetical protein
MSELQHHPEAPNKMLGYSDDEKALARQVQEDARAKEIQEKNLKRKRRTKKFVATALATSIVLAGGAAAKAKLGGGTSSESEPSVEPSVGAPVVPGEVETEAVDAVVGEPGSTIKNISVYPTQEIIDEALKPVTVKDYPTPQAALDRFADIENVLYLSADIDTESGSSEFPESQASIELRQILRKNIYSPEALELRNTRKDELPSIIAMELWFINESGAISTDKTATWHREWLTKGSFNEVSDNVFAGVITVRTETNIGELDELASKNYLDIAPVVEYDTDVQLSNDGDTWQIDRKEVID